MARDDEARQPTLAGFSPNGTGDLPFVSRSASSMPQGEQILTPRSTVIRHHLAKGLIRMDDATSPYGATSKTLKHLGEARTDAHEPSRLPLPGTTRLGCPLP
ncbi:hypothetical protein [Streptomyces acidiscabies]|uniref:hypothetical protein n=1 Tax=Streptomyces acidiscabies TaxID=42234 RepID=UPI0038F79545